MDFLFIFLGMNTLAIFLFKREWLLKKRSFIIILFFNILLFIFGFVMNSEFKNLKMAIALKMALLSQLIFIGLVAIFRKIYNREPVDTFWTMDVNLMKDGLFNFFFWITAIILPAILVFTGLV